MTPRDELDTADMLGVAEGDREALGRLYDHHGPALLALATQILRDRREAEDLLHDVFVEVWRRAGDYDPTRGSVAGWIHLRTRCRALDRVRSARVSRSLPLEHAPERVSDVSPAAGAESGAEASALHAALSTLPGEQRIVLLLGYFEGLSSAEIAARVGVPIGTVKSRVAAAMAKLRNELGPLQGGAP